MADTIYVAQTPTGSNLDASTHHLGMEIAATANGFNLFPLSLTPTTHTDTNAVEVGVKFAATTAGTITGIRFYKTSLNTGTHIGSLWTSAGVLLAQATFTGETATGWQQVLFGTPVTITPGTTYVASYFAPVGRYARNASFFTTPYARGPLTAPSGTNGVFRYTAVPAFPNSSSASSNYWVDVVFVPTALRKVTGGRAWVHADGRPTTFFWQLWRTSDQTLLAEVNLNLLPAAPAGWLSFTSADFTTPGDVPLSATESYVVNVFVNGGRYVFTDDGSETLPVGTGIVLATTARSGIGQVQGTFPVTTSVAYYFADVTVDLQLSTGTLDVTLPALTVELTGEATAAGTLDVTLPAATFEASGIVSIEDGALDITLPALTITMEGASAAGGATVGPCGWIIPAPLCCDEWAELPAAVQSSAQDYAALVLWAATGRQYGLCTVQVRPCGMRPCADGMAEFYGFDWSGGTWTPYIFNGTWYNCMCSGGCSCNPRCQVRLMGPVDSITEVTIGGIAVPPESYRVDDEHWLVRTDGECWPSCADMDSDDGDNVFVVTYVRGGPVPPALLRAASTLACEWGKGCTGAECRLSNRVTSLARNGISISMASPDEFLDDGLTGLWDVDAVIKALNPYRRKTRGRIYAPELKVPRQVTTP